MTINKRVKTANKSIKQFKEELARCKNQIGKMGPGLAQRVMEVRKKRLIKEKRWYASCLKSANIELKGMMKILQDDQEDLMGHIYRQNYKMIYVVYQN
uniref:Uncharacterized protein n=1 Tax=Lactuca sativa TaxID=4236 RepID=A0A9R1WSE9_LACSA|nr:hypothetical protein LSAT_V11C900471900 [Lactuca sativa]